MTSAPRIPDPAIPCGFDPGLDYSPGLKHALKSIAYPILLPGYSSLMNRLNRLGGGDAFDREDVWFGSRGTEYDQLMFEADRAFRFAAKTVLLQGVGDSKELVFWKHYHPASVIGVDFALPPGPPPGGLGFKTRFIAANLAAMPLDASSVDGVASLNVYEHVRDLDAVLDETLRVLRPGGWFLATFGPLYHAPGGDHICLLRGGLENAYAHLLMDPEEYRAFLKDMLIPGTDTVEGRPHFVELDLFSRLRFDDYRKAFGERFDLVRFRGHLDPRGLKFREEHPKKWAALLERGHKELDLLLSSVVAFGTRR